MDTPLLDTKLFLPVVRTRRVARERLCARLDLLREGKLALVSAPAGCGKTTLVADWIGRLPQRWHDIGANVAWLSVDDGDNDPARFLAYVIAALQQVYPGAGRTVEGVMGVPLPPNQIATLTARTEGWVTGLQLAALSLRDIDPADRGHFVASFSGDYRQAAGYLLNETFVHQSPTVQTFLLCTSVVDRFCGALCDALVPGSGIVGRDMLERLEASDVLLVPLDEGREWYRYHHLFRDFVRARLERLDPALVRQLHLRASQWLADNGRVREAIKEALLGGCPDRAAALIDTLGFHLSQEGSDGQILRWVDQIPPALQADHPWLRIAQLNALCRLERYEELTPLLESLETDRARFPDLPIATCTLLVRAWCVLRTRYEPRELLSLGQQAHEQLTGQPATETTHLLRAMAELYIGHGHWNLGNRADASAAFEATVRHGRQAHSTPAVLRGLVQQALFYQAVGPFARCADVCEEGIQMAERAWAEHTTPMPPADLVATLEGLLSLMLILWNRPDEAEPHARRAAELSELAGSDPRHYLEFALLNLAWVHCARGEHSMAFAILRRIERALRECSPEVREQVGAKLVRLRIALANENPERRFLLRDVEDWVARARLDRDHPERNRVRDYEAYGCGLMAIGRTEEAIPWLALGLAKTHAQGWVLSELLAAMWLAIAHYQVGNEPAALAAMARSLALAEPQGCVGVFFEYGPTSLALLQRLRAALPRPNPPYSRITPGFVDSILALYPPWAPVVGETAPERIPQPLIEPLSDRELDVLRLLAQGLRNHEIAENLYVTSNTVGFHLKNIYGKLDVHNRTEAVVVARELAIIA